MEKKKTWIIQYKKDIVLWLFGDYILCFVKFSYLEITREKEHLGASTQAMAELMTGGTSLNPKSNILLSLVISGYSCVQSKCNKTHTHTQLETHADDFMSL